MRHLSTAESSARIVLGGRVAGYSGQLPGVIEEAVITLRAGKPLYIVGGCGGAAHVLVEALRGDDPMELTTAWCQAEVPGWTELMAEARRRGHAGTAPEDVATELRTLGASGAAGALRNGLDERDNEELLETANARRAVTLILRGLKGVSA